jgi:hypothetical protein
MQRNQEFQDGSISAFPLQITQGEKRGVAYVCVSRGPQELVIDLSKGKWNTVRINGASSSIEQGREFLCELIDVSSQREFPRFGVRSKETQQVSYEHEYKTALLWHVDLVELTQQMIDADLTLRKCRPDEFVSMSLIADEFDVLFGMK